MQEHDYEPATKKDWRQGENQHAYVLGDMMRDWPCEVCGQEPASHYRMTSQLFVVSVEVIKGVQVR